MDTNVKLEVEGRIFLPLNGRARMNRRGFAGVILASVSGFIFPQKIKADIVNLNDLPRPPKGTRITSRPLSVMAFDREKGEHSACFRIRAMKRVREFNHKRIISINENLSSDKIIFWCER